MRMAGVNMRDRLALKNQRRDKIIKFPRLQIDTSARFFKRIKVGFMSSRGSVVKLLKITTSLTVTGVANIRWL